MRRVEILIDLVKHNLPWRITRLREQHGLTGLALSSRCGLSASTISQIERGKFAGVRFETILSLAAYFEVGLDYMAGLDHAALVRGIALRELTCPECGRLDGHSVAQCAVSMFERGRTHAYIAARCELTVATVECMLREEMRVLRERAARE
jgi:transcriptional regulator with XRE-family HTH domain